MLISPKKLENVLKKLKNGKGSFTGSDHSRCFESTASRMFGEIGETAVADVLGYDFPGRLAVLFDGNGSESGGCNVLDQVQANCWAVCDAKGLELRMAQVTPSTEIRESTNCVCAEDACGCWTFSAVASGRVVKRVAERKCGSTTGCEESVRPCGPSSGLQGNEVARCELFLDGFDCRNLECKLYESALGDGFVEQSSDEPRSAGVSSHLHNDHGSGVARLCKELDNTRTGLEAGRLCAGCDLLCGRRGVGRCIDVCCRNNGDRGDRKTEGGRSVCWYTENTLDKLPEDDGQKHHGGWTAVLWEEVLEFCGVKGVLGRERKTRDRTQICSSQQMYGEVETSSEFQVLAVEHCKDNNVAGFPLEFECLDDGQGPKRQTLRAGVRGWWRTSSA